MKNLAEQTQEAINAFFEKHPELKENFLEVCCGRPSPGILEDLENSEDKTFSIKIPKYDNCD